MWRRCRVAAGRRCFGEQLESRVLMAAQPDLVPVSFTPSNQTMPGLTTVSVTFTVQNVGAIAAGAFDTEFFWSADALFDNGDEAAAPLASNDPFYQPGNTNAVSFTSLAAGYQVMRVVTLVVTASPLVGTSGICYLGIRVDESNAVAEANETNNYGRGAGVSESEMFWSTEVYRADMNSNPGWSLQGDWAYGVPAGNAGDPVAGATGSDVIGYNLDGAYADNIAGTNWATTPSISTVGYTNITLSFMRWLNIEESLYDNACVAASVNGTTWTTIWSNPPDAPHFDSQWASVTYAMPSQFEGRPGIYIRWGLGPTDFMVAYGGWNIDDVVVRGQAGTSATPGAPDLIPASDTGASSTDNTTNLDNSSSSKRLTFRVGGTVAGATVRLYCDGVAVGSAVASGATTDVLTDGTSDIPDGTHQMTARQTQPGMGESAGSPALSMLVDTLAPTQQSFAVGDGAAQRSMVKSLQIVFGEQVDLTAALLLHNGSGGSVSNVGMVITNPLLDKRTYLVNFSGPAVTVGSLPDGMYSLYVNAAGVADIAGNAMAAPRSNRFHRLFGDADGDRDVDNADLLKFRQALNEPGNYSTYWYFDCNDDFAINNADYAQFKQRLSRRVLK